MSDVVFTAPETPPAAPIEDSKSQPSWSGVPALSPSQGPPPVAPEPPEGTDAPSETTISVGKLVSYSYPSASGDGTTTVDHGVVVSTEARTHTNPDGTVVQEGEHVVVAWLRDLSSPLPVGILTEG